MKLKKLKCPNCGDNVNKVFNIKEGKRDLYVCHSCYALHHHENRQEIPYGVDEQFDNVNLKLSEMDILVIEDIFFTHNDFDEYERMRPRLQKIWQRLCKAHDKVVSN